MGLLDDDRLERSAVVANCRMNRERGLLGSNGYDRELGFDPIDLPQGSARPRHARRLAGPLLRLGQGPDRGGDDHSRRGPGHRDHRRGSGRHVPTPRPRPDVPSARRGIADDLAARPELRPDHLRPRPPLRRRQARPDRPCRLVAGRGRAVRGQPRPGEPQAGRRPCGGTQGLVRPAASGPGLRPEEAAGRLPWPPGRCSCRTATSGPTTGPGRTTRGSPPWTRTTSRSTSVVGPWDRHRALHSVGRSPTSIDPPFRPPTALVRAIRGRRRLAPPVFQNDQRNRSSRARPEDVVGVARTTRRRRAAICGPKM